MPDVARLEGARIVFFFNEHPPPHFHAVYGEFLVSVSIDKGTITKGFIPSAKFAMIRQWMEPRKEALREAFEKSVKHIDPGVIE